MIKVKDGKLQAELLDNKGTLSNKIIEQYDYIELKNDFAEIVDILSTNMLVHAIIYKYVSSCYVSRGIEI